MSEPRDRRPCAGCAASASLSDRRRFLAVVSGGAASVFVASGCSGSSGCEPQPFGAVTIGQADVPAMGVHCGKTGMKLVDSKNPEQSLIVLKLTTSPPCGSPMPLGSGPSGLKPEQLTCIHDYVVGLAGRAH